MVNHIISDTPKLVFDWWNLRRVRVKAKGGFRQVPIRARTIFMG